MIVFIRSPPELARLRALVDILTFFFCWSVCLFAGLLRLLFTEEKGRGGGTSNH